MTKLYDDSGFKGPRVIQKKTKKNKLKKKTEKFYLYIVACVSWDLFFLLHLAGCAFFFHNQYFGWGYR